MAPRKDAPIRAETSRSEPNLDRLSSTGYQDALAAFHPNARTVLSIARVAFGLIASFWPRVDHFRFTPTTRHSQRRRHLANEPQRDFSDKGVRINEDQFASLASQALIAISRRAMIATKIICLSDVMSDGSSLTKAGPWDGFAGSRKTAAETF